MTLRVVTVKSAGGDYSSLNAAFVGEIGDLVALDRQLQIDCYNFIDTTAADMGAGWTTDSTHYVLVTAVDNHGGIFGGSGGTSAYSLDISATSALNINADYTRIVGLSIHGDGEASTYVRTPNCRLERCFLFATHDHGYPSQGVVLFSGGTDCRFDACIARGDDAFKTLAMRTEFYDCTAIAGDFSGFDIVGAAQVALVKNCLGVLGVGLEGAFFLEFGGTFHASSTSNASDDTSAPGTNSRISQTFTFVNAPASNYHLSASDTGALGYGTPLTSDGITRDIDNRSILAPWNIGADQFGFVPGTNDIILRNVPADANPNDVRLYDPTLADEAFMAIGTSAEASSDATLSEHISAAIDSSAEQSSDATVVERIVLATTTSAEQSSAATMAEHISASVTTSAEQSSAATLSEHISAAITTSTEAYSDAVVAERAVGTVDTSAEAYSAAALSVTNPPAVSIGIATSTEAYSGATVGIPVPEDEGVEQGRGGQFADRYPHIPQRLTVRVESNSPAVTSDAVMGVRIPEPVVVPKIHIGMRVASRIGALSSHARLQERIGATVTSSIEVWSDSAFEERVTLSAVEYERMTDTLDDDEVMMLHEMAMA